MVTGASINPNSLKNIIFQVRHFVEIGFSQSWRMFSDLSL